jgi:hypothetical protein
LLEQTPEREEIIERVAALDIGKAELVCCARVPGGSGQSRRLQEVKTYKTMTRSLLVMVDRLKELDVTRVIMEATSEYWKSPFYLLEAAGFETWLINAKDVNPDLSWLGAGSCAGAGHRFLPRILCVWATGRPGCRVGGRGFHGPRGPLVGRRVGFTLVRVLGAGP